MISKRCFVPSRVVCHCLSRNAYNFSVESSKWQRPMTRSRHGLIMAFPHFQGSKAETNTFRAYLQSKGRPDEADASFACYLPCRLGVGGRWEVGSPCLLNSGRRKKPNFPIGVRLKFMNERSDGQTKPQNRLGIMTSSVRWLTRRAKVNRSIDQLRSYGHLLTAVKIQ